MSDAPTEPDFDQASEINYLTSAPVETILGNHLFVLLQVAALRLGESPPNLTGASMVIDAVSAILAVTGDRLGENVELYRVALAEIQQAYVRATASPQAD